MAPPLQRSSKRLAATSPDKWQSARIRTTNFRAPLAPRTTSLVFSAKKSCWGTRREIYDTAITAQVFSMHAASFGRQSDLGGDLVWSRLPGSGRTARDQIARVRFASPAFRQTHFGTDQSKASRCLTTSFWTAGPDVGLC